jgi:serine/threonine-protein kinase
MEPERIGSTIDARYRVTELIGTGGMGAVYRADDLGEGHPVALKILRPHLGANKEATARFRREATVGGKLVHPNCVGISAIGTCDDGAIYLAMELVEGRSLHDVLEREGPLPWRRALEITRHLLRGLRHAHDQGVVHRDVKPDNIVLCRGDDGAEVARILDFGIAKLVGESSSAAITQAGLTVGTPEYLSPEQAAAGRLDGRSDLYSLSVVLFEMLTGTTPFRDADLMKILVAHTNRPVPPIAEVAPGVVVPPEVEALIRDGLAKLPEERVPSAAAYLMRLEALLAPPDQTIELSALDPAIHSVVMPAVKPPPVPPPPFARPVARPVARAQTPPVAPPTPRPARFRPSRRQLAIAGTCGGVLLVGIIAAIATREPAPPAAPPAATSAAAAPAEIEMEEESGASAGAEVARALQLTSAGRKEDAVKRLRELRKRYPDDPQVPYALGRVYRLLNWPKQTIEAYRNAIQLDPGYREDPALIADLVSLLASKSSWQLAARALEQDVGAAAAPALAEAADGHRDATVRKRAANVRDRL